jgi:hypothetical protein
MHALRYEQVSPSGARLFFVAARHDVTPAERAGIPQRHSVDWEATRLAIELFRQLTRAARRTRGPIRWYKGLDVESLHACVQRFDWSGTKLDTASGILSTTILAHPFPNANHRTSLSLTRLYLSSVDVDWPHYTLRGRGAQRLHRDTHGFFRESKYLLQILRHPQMVRTALEEGYTHLGIGPETEASIRPEDFILSAAEVRALHRDVCRNLLHDLASASAKTELSKPNPRRLREWVAWVQG